MTPILVTFTRLCLWRDPVRRSGPENMAVDEWLLEQVSEPLLRIYEWEGDWVSLGYFGKLRDARGAMRGGSLVRRPTGGGIVDHRKDRTYTLVVPRGHRLVSLRGDESYRVIHTALAEAMRAEGMTAGLIEEDARSESTACFEKPVAWDIVDEAGRKLAGAGQRRSRNGLLHQGSVVLSGGAGASTGLFDALADRLGGDVQSVLREPRGEDLAAKVEKFESREWLERR